MVLQNPKLKSRAEAATQIKAWKDKGLKVAFTNGCFDILHAGHVDYLQKTKALGDKLVLALNTDSSVSRLKGPSRPVVDQEARAFVLGGLSCVDLVVFFDEATPKETIEMLNPDILTKGSDYSIDTIVGADFVLSNGGEVKTLDLVEGFSTTSVINKIKNI